MRDQYEHWLEILMMVSGIVLLIVCSNVANLMLVRGLERRRELSLSTALGAPAGRLVRQALTESILLSLAGGAAGLVVAFGGTRLILHFAFPRMASGAGIPIGATPSAPVLLFAFGISMLTGVAFGIVPAWMATRVDPIEALRGAGRSTVRTNILPRKTLVVMQASLSLVLMATSGLLTAALQHLENQRFGFVQNGRTIVGIDPRLAGYKPAQLTPLYAHIQDALMSIPGVAAVSLCSYSPMSGDAWGAHVWIDGRSAPGPRDDAFSSWDRVTAGFFATIGNPILRGRGITDQDLADSRHVAVVNQAFARKFFGQEDPIGKHFSQEGMSNSRDYEIVGVVQDARFLNYELDKPPGPFFFLPEAQHDFLPHAPATDANPGTHFMHHIVVVASPGTNLQAAPIRRAMASVDPGLPLIFIMPLSKQVSGQFSQQRLMAQLTSGFAILSLILASIGLYGVTAYNAASRTNEIGVRLALGATRAQAAGLIIQGALALLTFGLIVGFPLAIGVGRFLGSQLYGLSPYEPAVILMAVATLGISGLAASTLPALRSSSISPTEALRAE